MLIENITFSKDELNSGSGIIKSITDIVLPVPSPIYEKIFLPFIEQTDRGDILESKGMKDLLTGMIYFYYVRDQYTQMSTLGAVKNKGERPGRLSPLGS